MERERERPREREAVAFEFEKVVLVGLWKVEELFHDGPDSNGVHRQRLHRR